MGRDARQQLSGRPSLTRSTGLRSASCARRVDAFVHLVALIVQRGRLAIPRLSCRRADYRSLSDQQAPRPHCKRFFDVAPKRLGWAPCPIADVPNRRYESDLDVQAGYLKRPQRVDSGRCLSSRKLIAEAQSHEHEGRVRPSRPSSLSASPRHWNLIRELGCRGQFPVPETWRRSGIAKSSLSGF